ncbi:hypothetical protein RSSM_04251, partial [Rhodopirellula sallentina SM41]
MFRAVSHSFIQSIVTPMFTLLAENAAPGFINPMLLTTVAIFLGVASISWLVINKISGSDQEPAESRLDRMKQAKRGIRNIEADEKAR